MQPGIGHDGGRALDGLRAGAPRLVLVLSLLVPAPAPAQEIRVPAPQAWVGEDGAPLPFRDEGEVLGFLSTARVESREVIPRGVNKPLRVVLSSEGVRARAVFRRTEFERRDAQIGDRFFVRFKDSCHNECAAYSLSRALGLQSVPPTVPRRLDGKSGSLQLWIEGGRDVVGFEPANVASWVRQVWDKDLFDSLTFNVDRNSGNMIVGPGEFLWLIDHTRAFQPVPELLAPDAVKRVNRGVWERLGAMTDEDLRRLVEGALDGGQLSALVLRRQLLLDHVESLLPDVGEHPLHLGPGLHVPHQSQVDLRDGRGGDDGPHVGAHPRG